MKADEQVKTYPAKNLRSLITDGVRLNPQNICQLFLFKFLKFKPVSQIYIRHKHNSLFQWNYNLLKSFG